MSTPFVNVPTRVETKVFCKCPLCEKHDFRIDHLFNDAAKRSEGYYPVYWSCDKCRAKFDIRVFADRHVEFSQTGTEENPFLPAVILLKSNTGDDQDRPIYAVVRAGTHKDAIDKEKAERFSSHLDYYYNEGTCPTNWWRNTVCLIQDQDEDPHGCFEFVGVLDEAELIERLKKMPDADQQHVDDPKQYIEDNVRLIFPQLFEDGETYEGSPLVDLFIESGKPDIHGTDDGFKSMDLPETIEDEIPPMPQSWHDKVKPDRQWSKSQEQIHQENAQAWRELFTRIDRRELGVSFRSQCLMSPIQYETMRKAPAAEHHPLVFDFIVGFMNQNQIPLLSMPDPLAALEAPQLPDIGRGRV